MKVLVGCEVSGVVRDAFAARGHDAWSCDIRPSQSNGKHLQQDLLSVLGDGWDLMVAHPPCTHLAVSGAAWFATKPEQLRDDAVAFAATLMTAPIPKIAIENPVSILSTRIGKPDQYYHPYEFGYPEAKKTCLWLQNLPRLVPTQIVTPLPGLYDIAPDSKLRSDRRSRTPLGVARAMAEQWG